MSSEINKPKLDNVATDIVDNSIEKAILKIGDTDENSDLDTILVNGVYDKVKSLVEKKRDITVEVVLSLTLDTIKITQELCKDYEGKYKKLIVIAIIRKLIKEHDYQDEDIRAKILSYVDDSLPNFIDISISLAKGAIDLGKNLSITKKLAKGKCC